MLGIVPRYVSMHFQKLCRWAYLYPSKCYDWLILCTSIIWMLWWHFMVTGMVASMSYVGSISLFQITVYLLLGLPTWIDLFILSEILFTVLLSFVCSFCVLKPVVSDNWLSLYLCFLLLILILWKLAACICNLYDVSMYLYMIYDL